MHILLIGSGGREHAMAWKLAQSAQVTRVTVAPGNTGTAAEPNVETLAINVDDIDALLAFACDNQVALTIVGPEGPLVAGIVDRFQAAGQRIFGPNAAAAQLEGSKAFAKSFMQRHHIPTARHQTFSDAAAAISYIELQGAPIVIKADGLAAGKGVVVAQTLDEARNAVTAMLGERAFGDAGATVVVEEFLVGEEASFIAVVAGTSCLPFASSQDHKARDEGDKGPNTGGMGAYSPALVVDETVHAHIVADILQPTVDALAAEGMPFLGFLYIGLMIDAQGQGRVVEYNVRLGDPETQPLLMRLDSDLFTLLDAAVDARLNQVEASWNTQSALGIVLTAGDYPQGSSYGEVITGIEDAEALGCKVFHAGTIENENGELVTHGGRVLCVTALGKNIRDAKTLADQGAARVHWSGVNYRCDIGYRAVARLRE
jgi:phosphoribosylamine--glycine ligase